MNTKRNAFTEVLCIGFVILIVAVICYFQIVEPAFESIEVLAKAIQYQDYR